MITEDYVSLELDKLLKKKGFDQNCAHYYLDGTIYRHHPTEVLPIGKETFAAPTLAQVLKWLRNEKDLWIIVLKDDDYGWKYKPQSMIHFDMFNGTPYTGYYDSYEECVSAAIKYCLENLI